MTELLMVAKPKVGKPAQPIVRTTLTASAFEQLISYVVKGHWKAGDRIPPERELCQQLGIARTSLREALKAMELIGMLDSRIGDGTFVCPRSEFLSRPLLWAFTGTDHAELRDIMEAREFLERDLAGLAAERASDTEIKAIEATRRTQCARTSLKANRFSTRTWPFTSLSPAPRTTKCFATPYSCCAICSNSGWFSNS